MQPTQPSQFEHAALKNYLLDHAYDEMFAGSGELHQHYRAAAGALLFPAGEGVATAEAGGGPQLSESGHHVHGVWARGRYGEDLSV